MEGIEREIDDVGRVVIPMEFRKKLGIEFNSRVSISLSGEQVIIKAKSTLCALCGETVDNNKRIKLCNKCINRVKNET